MLALMRQGAPASRVVIMLVAACCWTVGRLAAQAVGECRKLSVSSTLKDQLTDALAAETPSEGRPIRNGSISFEARPVRLDSVCVFVAALSWNSGFGGGLVFFVPRKQGSAQVLQVDVYPGARGTFEAGNRRVGFRYAAGRGSGVMEERTAVLCALSKDSWVVCADLLTDENVAPTGYSLSDARAIGLQLKMTSHASVVGDTLVVETESIVKRYGSGPVHRRWRSTLVLP